MHATIAEPPILHNALVFGRILRRAGIPVSPEQGRSFARALEWIDLGRRDQVFHTARSLLVHRREDLDLFEVIFNRFWRRPGATDPVGLGSVPSAPRRHRHERRPVEVLSFLAGRNEPDAAEVDVQDRTGTYSPQEALRRKDF